LRNEISKKEAIARVEAQWPIEKKLSLSDTAINNSGTQKNTMLQIDKALKHL
jgi:dephospho-CoA kinase